MRVPHLGQEGHELRMHNELRELGQWLLGTDDANRAAMGLVHDRATAGRRLGRY